ncbi:MAG: SDR family NAD(P)-dependent oxidoreductase [Pseudomonadota bacterium]
MNAKTILITGATDGIGLETAKALSASGHRILLHGRSAQKLDAAAQALTGSGGPVETFLADFSVLSSVAEFAQAIFERSAPLDVVINNAGVLKAPEAITQDGLDIRFAVNLFAPVLLMRRLLPVLSPTGRIVNLSSAAQSPVSIAALTGTSSLAEMEAYAQSKLALTIWSQELAQDLPDGQLSVAVNPGSLLGSKMVREGFGVSGGDLQVGVDVLTRAALSDEFAAANGQYFDNDSHRFAPPHPWAKNAQNRAGVMDAIALVLSKHAL